MKYEEINGKFLFTYIQRDSFNKLIMERCTGTSYPAISTNDLKTLSIRFPNIQEQEKIGQLFESIDNMIEAQTKLIENYKSLKKSLLQKMFI